MSGKKHTSTSKPGGFPGQHPDEEVLFVFRQHPLVMRLPLIGGLLAILVGLLPLLAFPLSNVALTIALVTPLLVVAFMFYHWIGWYYSLYIVTNERIVDIKQRGFFNRRVSETGLDMISSVNYHINGFQAVLFQFGDINIQTYTGEVKMPTIYRPVEIHEQLLRTVRDYGGSTSHAN